MSEVISIAGCRGIYIYLPNDGNRKHKVQCKFGISDNFARRFGDYDKTFDHEHAKLAYCFICHIDMDNIRSIETNVLDHTNQYRTSEWRILRRDVGDIVQILFDETLNEIHKYAFNYEIVKDVIPDKYVYPRHLSNSFEDRYYQNEAVKAWNYNTGILWIATGLGKTLILMRSIDKFLYKMSPKPILIIWTTRLKDAILSQQDDFSRFTFTKQLNVIIHMRFNKKYVSFNKYKNIKYNINTPRLDLDLSKNNLIITNTKQLSNMINLVPDLVIHDECHEVTGNDIYDILLKYRSNGAVIVGSSATPYKKEEKSYDRINEIFCLNNNLCINNTANIIYKMTIDVGISGGYLCPFDLQWCAIKHTGKITTEWLIENKMDDVYKYISQSKTGKILISTDTIQNSDKITEKLKEYYSSINLDYPIFCSHSENDPDSELLQNYIKSPRGIIVCVHRFMYGTNDPKLDMVICVDCVKSREIHVFIQKLGRALRKDTKKYPEKISATFVQLYDKLTEDEFFKNTLRVFQSYMDEEFDIKSNLVVKNNKINIITKNGTIGSMNFNDPDIQNEQTFIMYYKDIFDQLCGKPKSNQLRLGKFINILKANKITFATYFEFQKDKPELPIDPCNYMFKDDEKFYWNMIDDVICFNCEEFNIFIDNLSQTNPTLYDEIQTLINEEEIIKKLHNYEIRVPILFTKKNISLNHFYQTNKKYFKWIE